MDKMQVGFLTALMEDVQLALDRHALTDTSADRRNLLRTVVAAVDGASWVFRMHVLSIAKDFDLVTPLMEMAFSEASFSVSPNGDIIPQARYVSPTAMIRMTTKVAQSYCADLTVDFGGEGWRSLQDAIATRNRITHPKTAADLEISAAEMGRAKAGFYWFLDMSADIMERCVEALADRARITKELAGRLTAGDPEALDLYDRAHRDMLG